MRLAIFDLGTNSVRFDVHEIGRSFRTTLLYRDKQMVRLGQGVFNRHRLSHEAMERTLVAVAGFKQIADDLDVDRVVAYATAALREAKDGRRFIDRLSQRTGIRFRTISGEKEARLIVEGVLAHESFGSDAIAFIDIGGGSTEISVARRRKILRGISLPLGALRLQQRFLHRSPPRPTDFVRLHRYVVGVLYRTVAEAEWPITDLMVGSSGTVKTLARIIRRRHHLKHIRASHLRSLVTEMKTLGPRALAELPGMDPRRIDMILAGAVILERAMDMMHTSWVVPTDYTLRDGILLDEIRRLRHRPKKRKS